LPIKSPHQRISSDKQIDLLIVVDQMLTGFDSKWINTLYMDKKLEYQNIIQAFSRTNRLLGMKNRLGPYATTASRTPWSGILRRP